MWYKFTLPKEKFMYVTGVITISPRKKPEDIAAVTVKVKSSSKKKAVSAEG